MHILISNDDGIFAKGIQVLASTLHQKGNVSIVAPDRNRSGASNSLTLDAPLRIRRLQENQIMVEGTPTDCVHLAITGLLSHMPHIVVSGINEGSNLGDDVLYSGTVAAAIEGRFLGLPALAVSLANQNHGCQHYETAASVALKLLDLLAKDPLPVNTILNVNVPDVPLDKLRGMEVTRLGTRHRAEKTCEQLDPWGNKIYWIGPAGAAAEAGPGTDFYAIQENKVSITPLQVDLTQYKAFEQVATWLTKLA